MLQNIFLKNQTVYIFYNFANKSFCYLFRVLEVLAVRFDWIE